MSKGTTTPQREQRQRAVDALPGVALAIGGGAGVAIGVAVAGGTGIAIGAAMGAGLGLVAGAVAQSLIRRPSE
jgi:hypothetical protein